MAALAVGDNAAPVTNELVVSAPTAPVKVGPALLSLERRLDVLPWLVDEITGASENLIMQSRWYRLASDRDGRLLVLSADGTAVIATALRVASVWRQDGTERRHSAALRYGNTRVERANGTIELVVTASGPVLHTQLLLRCREGTPEIEVECRSAATHTSGSIDLDRHSITIDFVPPVAELYLKNRRVERRPLEASYWLDREGVAFGSCAQSAYVYHVPGLSSLQLETARRRLILNLDLAEDHPQLIDDPEGRFRDASRSTLLPMAVLCNDFVLGFGYRPPDLPRFMAQPGGYVASHVWAEHGCYTALPVHKAVYLGSDQIGDLSKATGGFVRHGIPTTKSVFYNNRTGVANDPQSPIFKGPMVAIRNNPDFSRLLDDLAQRGHDICLHCPQPESSEVEEIEESLAYMSDRYSSEVWIDHFWYRPDGVKAGCAESFCCRGLLGPAAELWTRYGVRFFWNAFYEYLLRENPRSGREILNHWVWDHSCPNPLYWRHPTLGVPTGEIKASTVPYVSWPTWRPWFPEEGALSYRREQLDTLIDDWGVSLTHVYTSYIGEANRAWMKDGEAIQITREFDQLLAEMANRQAEGLLLNTTIRDLMRYWLALEWVRLQPLPDRKAISVCNDGEKPLAGLALVCHTDTVRVDEQAPQGRWHGSDYVFWFDIPARSAVELTGFDDPGCGWSDLPLRAASSAGSGREQ